MFECAPKIAFLNVLLFRFFVCSSDFFYFFDTLIIIKRTALVHSKSACNTSCIIIPLRIQCLRDGV